MSRERIKNYLRTHCDDHIINLMNLPNETEHLSIYVDLSQLQQRDFDLFEAILCNADRQCAKWDKALLDVQTQIAEQKDAFLDSDYQIKVNCHVRFVSMPEGDARYRKSFPGAEQMNQFVEMKGSVMRMSQAKCLELKREFECTRCPHSQVVEADYVRMYKFDITKNCPVSNCKGTIRPKHDQAVPDYCIDYQELKIQESIGESNIPKSLSVTLENDLVSTCQPGDSVTICGIIKRRWQSYEQDRPCLLTIEMRANSLRHDQKPFQIDVKQQMEQMVLMQMEWSDLISEIGELAVRDRIVESICPDVYGMYPVKLAIALVVCSSGIDNTQTAATLELNHRRQSHLLLVGDPGLAKSHLLLSATQFAPRAISTTGMGCSSAGLTAAAVKEDGEWQLEAGALVLADGGICCIDEFNLMRPNDRSSIHEAMEQQTISMAKANIVCKLSTRCAILAAANPKNLHTMSEPGGISSLNIGIDSPLLSRFDLVYILRDERNPEWDGRIADHLLAAASKQARTNPRNETIWSIEKLRAHFVAARNVNPEMTEEAHDLLGAYYLKCRNDPQRDLGRTTVRLLDSLCRLAKAHARLLLRQRVNAYDAAIVIRLMESTHGFGRIIPPFHVIEESLPLGPDSSDIEEVRRVLNVEGARRIDDEPNENDAAIANVADNNSVICAERLTQKEVVAVSDNLNESVDVEPAPTTPEPNRSNAMDEVEDMDADDLILSQALEQIEQSIVRQNVPLPPPPVPTQLPSKIPSNPPVPQNRFNLSTTLPNPHGFTLHTSQQASTSIRFTNNRPLRTSKAVTGSLHPKTKAPVRNRLLLTQSDDEDDAIESTTGFQSKRPNTHVISPPRQVSSQTIKKLKMFENPNLITDKNESKPANDTKDSAYDTISSSAIQSQSNLGNDNQMYNRNAQPMAAPTNLVNSNQQDDDDDFSCLEFDL